MRNCPITRCDIKMAQVIYEKNRAIIQGKTVRKQVPHVREEINSVPDNILKQYKDVTLSCNIIHINGNRFLVTISRHINFRTVRGLTNMKKGTLLSALKSAMAIY